MSLLQAQDVTKSYGAQDVLRDVTIAVPHQARIALVGANGVGKSTLLRVLAGVAQPDGGRIQRAKDLRVGYLPQEAPAAPIWSDAKNRTLWELCLEAFRELRRMEEELAGLETAMSDPREAPAAMDRYGQVQEAFERAGGYGYEAEVEKVLRGLGFASGEFDRPLSAFSGGERTRALLGRLLLEDADLLILDEPTNHLDFEAIEWLEGWLADWPGAAVIVSHDRYFLDQTVSVVWDLTERGLVTYPGNYSDYAEQRGARRERAHKVLASRRAHVEREQEFIRRNIAGQNSKQAQGRRKRLERFRAEHQLNAPSEEPRAAIEFSRPERSGEIVLKTEGLEIGRAGAVLFKVPDLIVRRGERAAILGPNGAGKTSLLQTLIGELPPASGKAERGANVKVGYFAQGYGQLNPEATVLEVMLAADPDLTAAAAQEVLGRYHLRGDAVEKKVEDLSGGERGRLGLARLARQDANLLLLDEPTNHLDIASQEVLQDALEEFEGTILLVSHDRYLVDALATQVWVMDPGRRELEVVAGGHQAFLDLRRHRQTEAADRTPGKRRTAAREPGTPSANKMRLRMERIEERIEELEQAQRKLSARIEASRQDPAEIQELGARYAGLEAELQDHLSEWEDLARRLESA